MTFEILEEITKGYADESYPLGGKNFYGENIIIYKGKRVDGVRFFRVKTAQHNGWIRIKWYYEDGTTEETYEK